MKLLARTVAGRLIKYKNLYTEIELGFFSSTIEVCSATSNNKYYNGKGISSVRRLTYLTVVFSLWE